MVYHLGQLSLATSSPAAALIIISSAAPKNMKRRATVSREHFCGRGGSDTIQKEFMVLWFLLVLLVLEEKQYQLCF